MTGAVLCGVGLTTKYVLGHVRQPGAWVVSLVCAEVHDVYVPVACPTSHAPVSSDLVLGPVVCEGHPVMLFAEPVGSPDQVVLVGPCVVKLGDRRRSVSVVHLSEVGEYAALVELGHPGHVVGRGRAGGVAGSGRGGAIHDGDFIRVAPSARVVPRRCTTLSCSAGSG